MISLLQSNFYQTQTDWQTLAVMGGIIVSIIIALAIYSRNAQGPSRGRGGKRFSRRAFRREAASIGLTKYQTRMLESFTRTYQVRRPFNLLSNTRELNVTLGKALRDIPHYNAKESTIELKKLEIYRIKQRIDRVFADTNRLSTTRQLRLGQNITFQQDNGNRFTSVITANLKEFYCASSSHELWGRTCQMEKGKPHQILHMGFGWGRTDV